MDQIEDCLSFYLGKAYQRVTQSAKQRLAPYGVTPVQYALLKVLWEHDHQSGAQLGERLQLDSATMTGLLDRALARGVQPALYTEEMFSTTHDAANLDAVRSVEREDLNLVGIAIRAERKVVDKIVDKLKFHQ